MYYTGIGSRETPREYMEFLYKVGKFLALNNYILRSGHAEGSDSAFEFGCDKVCGKKEIYIPWDGFNNSKSELVVISKRAFDIAEKYHPAWENLKDSGRRLMARNSHQVLGKDLNTPSKFLICWTKNGKGSGGTGQAIRIAKDYDIPIFDAGLYDNIFICNSEFKEFYQNIKFGGQ